MQYQQSMQGLQQMYDLPVAMAPQAMGLLDQQQRADAMTEQDQARELAYNTANDPLKLQGKGLENQTLAAQLGGHQARSNQEQRKDSNEAAINPQVIQDMLGKLSSADIKRHVDDTEQVGNRVSQMAAEVLANPVGARARVKAELHKMGHGDMWSPTWESNEENDDPIASSQLFSNELAKLGRNIQTTSSKFRNAVDMQEMKAQVQREAMEAKERMNALNAQQRERTAANMMAVKKQIAMIPKSVEDYAAKMSELAAAEENPDKKAFYLEESSKAYQRAAVLKAMAAATTTAQKLDYTKILGQDSSWGVNIAVPDPAAPAKPASAPVGPPQGTPTPTVAGAKDPANMPAPKAPPAAGTVEGGYRFKGGDPSKQENWEKV